MTMVTAMFWFIFLWISCGISATDKTFDIHFITTRNLICSHKVHRQPHVESSNASREETRPAATIHRPKRGLFTLLPVIIYSFSPNSSSTTSTTSGFSAFSSSAPSDDVMWIDVLAYTTTPLLFVIGVTGNTLILRVMMSRSSRQMTVSHVLGMMSIADLILDFTAPFTKSSLTKLFGYDVKGLSVIGCKVFYWFYRTSKFVSSSLLTLIAVERFVAVYFPTHMKRVFSKRNAYVVMTFVLISMSLFNAFWGATADWVIKGACLSNSVPNIFGYIMTSFVIYAVIPTVVMGSMNACVIYRLVVLERKKRSQMGGGGAPATKTQSQKITTVLLTLNAAFIILTNPSSFIYQYGFYQGQNIYQINNPIFVIFREISFIMEQMNYSFNIFFYFAFNKSFRDSLRKMMPCFRGRVNAVSTLQAIPSIY